MRRPDPGPQSKSWTALAVALASLSMLLLPSSALASSWSGVQLPGEAGKVFLLGISCPTPSFCVAVGTNNLIASSNNPTGSSGAWDFIYAGEGPQPEPERPPGAAQPPPPRFLPGHQIQGVSCPSTGLCVAVMNQGNIYSSTNPTGPASAWKTADIDGKGPNTHLYGVSCPSTSLCIAVAGKGKGAHDAGQNSEILTATDPTGAASVWQAAELSGSIDLRAVSCATPRLCVAVGLGARSSPPPIQAVAPPPGGRARPPAPRVTSAASPASPRRSA